MRSRRIPNPRTSTMPNEATLTVSTGVLPWSEYCGQHAAGIEPAGHCRLVVHSGASAEATVGGTDRGWI